MEALRRILYFGGEGVLIHLLVIVVWCVAAVAVTAAIAGIPRRSDGGLPLGIDR